MNFMKRILFTSVLSGAVLFCTGAEAGIVTDQFPIQMYADHQVSTYNRAGDSRRAGWADANTDLIRVYSVSNGWARISHPGKGGRTVNRYCRVNDLFADPGYANRSARVQGAQRTYRTKSGSATIGSVSNNEEVTVLADNGTRAQILYRLDNGTGYKIGWVPRNVLLYGQDNVDGRMKGDVNGDGKVDDSDVALLEQYLVELVSSVPCPKNADVNGDGRYTLTDVSRLELMIKQPRPVPPEQEGLIVNSQYNVSVSPKSKENLPHYENRAGRRKGNVYNSVIDQFNVVSNNRYRRTSSATYCNIFAWDVMSAMNVTLPHWLKNNVPANSTIRGAYEINVNSTCVWMNNYARQYGWRTVSASEAQARANSGYPTLAIWKNPTGKSGHIAVVRPEGNGYFYDANKGPVIAQAGASNYSYTNVSRGFGSAKMNAIVYWTHD